MKGKNMETNFSEEQSLSVGQASLAPENQASTLSIIK